MALNPIETIFLNTFLQLSTEKKIYSVQNLIQQNQFDFIVKLSCNSDEFNKICLNIVFHSTWESIWSTFGIIITGNPQGAFFVQPSENTFDLFLGAYFYNQSLALKGKAPSIEKSYLLEAIKYGSIHALQRYCFSVYECLDNEQYKTTVTESKIKELIIAIKAFLPSYGSYAYLMLSEAYIRYAMLKPEVALTAIHSGLKACEQASKLYSENDPAVFNASLGLGLAASNTMGYTTSEEASEAIKSLFYTDEPASRPPSKI